MKTPTKEQIEKIMRKTKDELECGNCETCSVYWECFDGTKTIITEWEKIRD